MFENLLRNPPNPSADEPALSVMGERTWILMDGAASSGRMAMFVVESQPGDGTPPHFHRREDEAFLVLEGEYTIMSDGREIVARKGEAIFGLRDVPHCFRNTGGTVGRLLVIVTPAGLEDFFREITGVLPEAPKDAEQVALCATICEKYGIMLLAGMEGSA